MTPLAAGALRLPAQQKPVTCCATAGALRLPALQKPVTCCATAGALTLTRPTKTGHMLRDGGCAYAYPPYENPAP
ncbi:hypothetical protein CDU02_08960 [Cronobacter sakazakii]|nr:hypothetical protein CDU02_08960 [Cronobacter sakazakii]